jgi:hypothetical protein
MNFAFCPTLETKKIRWQSRFSVAFFGAASSARQSQGSEEWQTGQNI